MGDDQNIVLFEMSTLQSKNIENIDDTDCTTTVTMMLEDQNRKTWIEKLKYNSFLMYLCAVALFLVIDIILYVVSTERSDFSINGVIARIFEWYYLINPYLLLRGFALGSVYSYVISLALKVE